MTPQRDNRVKVSALLRAGHKVSEVANLARTTVYAIKKLMGVGEGVNRRAGSGRKTVVDLSDRQTVSKWVRNIELHWHISRKKK